MFGTCVQGPPVHNGSLQQLRSKNAEELRTDKKGVKKQVCEKLDRGT